MLENKAYLIGIPAVSIAYGAAQLVEANALDIARVPQGGNLERRHAAEHYERGSPLLRVLWQMPVLRGFPRHGKPVFVG